MCVCVSLFLYMHYTFNTESWIVTYLLIRIILVYLYNIFWDKNDICLNWIWLLVILYLALLITGVFIRRPSLNACAASSSTCCLLALMIPYVEFSNRWGYVNSLLIIQLNRSDDVSHFLHSFTLSIHCSLGAFINKLFPSSQMSVGSIGFCSFKPMLSKWLSKFELFCWESGIENA